jgi:hypothetical protein
VGSQGGRRPSQRCAGPVPGRVLTEPAASTLLLAAAGHAHDPVGAGERDE